MISTSVPQAAVVWWSWRWRSHFWKQACRSLWPGRVCANEWLSTSANYSNLLSGQSFFIWVMTVFSDYSLAHQVADEVAAVCYITLSAGSDNLPPQQSCWSQRALNTQAFFFIYLLQTYWNLKLFCRIVNVAFILLLLVESCRKLSINFSKCNSSKYYNVLINIIIDFLFSS